MADDDYDDDCDSMLDYWEQSEEYMWDMSAMTPEEVEHFRQQLLDEFYSDRGIDFMEDWDD